MSWTDLTQDKARSLIMEHLANRPCDLITLYETNLATYIRNPPTPLDTENEVVRDIVPALLNEGFRTDANQHVLKAGSYVFRIALSPVAPHPGVDGIVIENDDNSLIRYSPRVYGCRSMVDSVDILDITIDPANPKRADVAYRINMKVPTTVAATYAKIKSLSATIAPQDPSPAQETITLQRLDATGWQIAI